MKYENTILDRTVRALHASRLYSLVVNNNLLVHVCLLIKLGEAMNLSILSGINLYKTCIVHDIYIIYTCCISIYRLTVSLMV